MMVNTSSSEREANHKLWREQYGEPSMRRFVALESAMLESAAELQRVMGPQASLTAYSRLRTQQWLSSMGSASLDPDKLFIKSRYRYRLGGREVIHDERRSLTEYAIGGQQDKDRISLTFEGQTSSNVSYFTLENWLSSVDMRSEYALSLIDNPVPAVYEAAHEHWVRQVEFTLFCNLTEHRLERFCEEWVQRLLQGDPSLMVRGIVLPGTASPLKNMFVIHQRREPQGRCVVFAPGAPSGKAWNVFENMADVTAHIGTWGLRHPEYIYPQVGSRYQLTMRQFFRDLAKNYNLWNRHPIQLVEYSDTIAGQPLSGFVLEMIRWDRFESIELAPPNYRNANYDQRQYYASLNTQLKALYTVEGREAALISYEKFTYDLIKQRIEGVLKERGEQVQVDPDLIMIEFGPAQRASLTSVITQEKAFYAAEHERDPTNSYPRYQLAAGHPPLKTLDIRDLAGWSRTLRPGEQYIEMLRTVHLNPQSPTHVFHRDVHIERQFAEMNRGALSAYFQGQIDRAQYDDFKQAIAALRTPDRYGGPVMGDYPVNQDSVYQFHLGRRRPVEGVYVFRFARGGEVRDYLYTPQAPDGVWLRPLDNFAGSVRFRGLRQYYLDRLHYVDRPHGVEYFDQIEATTSHVKAPDLEVNSRVRDFSKCYAQMILRVIDDVDRQTTSLAEIITKLTYDSVILAAQVVSLVIPPVGLAVSAVQITRNILDGAQAYHYRDQAKALDHFKAALVDLATLGYGKYKELGPKAVTSTQKTLIDLAGDVKTLASLVSAATGQKVPHEVLLDIVRDLSASHGQAYSKTLVR